MKLRGFPGALVLAGVTFSIVRVTASVADAKLETDIPGPEWFRQSLVYHNGFDREDGKSDVTGSQIASTDPIRRPAPVHGLFGSGLRVAKGAKPLVLVGKSLSMHAPFTLSFWWSPTKDVPETEYVSLFQIDAEAGGYVSAFVAGKGDWCALQQPAGVMQMYNFRGIKNVNAIYDFELSTHLRLKSGIWHHTAVVFRHGSEAQLYTDGKAVCSIQATGRDLPDGPCTITIGGTQGSEITLDEVSVLDRAIDADQAADYYRGIEHMVGNEK